MKMFFSVLALLTVSSFASAKTSGEFEFIALPAQPIVINADVTYGEGVFVQGPWFEYHNVFINNSVDKRLFVASVKFEGTSSFGGGTLKFTTSLDPGAGCPTGYKRPFLAVVEPGETFSGVAEDNSGTGSRCDMNMKTDFKANQFERWFIGALPAAENNFYSIDATAMGWTEDMSGNVIDRFEAVQHLETR